MAKTAPKPMDKPFGHDRRVKVQSKYIHMLAPFVDDTKSVGGPRDGLRGIYITPCNKGGVLMVATDGHRMGIIHDDEGEANKPWICPITKHIASSCRAKTAAKTCYFTGQYAHVTRGGWDSESPKSYVNHLSTDLAPPINGTYPDWLMVIPQEPPLGKPVNLFPFSFNAKFLGDLSRIGRTVSLVSGGPKEPTLAFVRAVPEFLGVIMPMKIEAPKFPPDWLPLP